MTVKNAATYSASAAYQRSPSIVCLVIEIDAEGMIAMVPRERHAAKSKTPRWTTDLKCPVLVSSFTDQIEITARYSAKSTFSMGTVRLGESKVEIDSAKDAI